MSLLCYETRLNLNLPGMKFPFVVGYFTLLLRGWMDFLWFESSGDQVQVILDLVRRCSVQFCSWCILNLHHWSRMTSFQSQCFNLHKSLHFCLLLGFIFFLNLNAFPFSPVLAPLRKKNKNPWTSLPIDHSSLASIHSEWPLTPDPNGPLLCACVCVCKQAKQRGGSLPK